MIEMKHVSIKYEKKHECKGYMRAIESDRWEWKYVIHDSTWEIHMRVHESVTWKYTRASKHDSREPNVTIPVDLTSI